MALGIVLVAKVIEQVYKQLYFLPVRTFYDLSTIKRVQIISYKDIEIVDDLNFDYLAMNSYKG